MDYSSIEYLKHLTRCCIPSSSSILLLACSVRHHVILGTKFRENLLHVMREPLRSSDSLHIIMFLVQTIDFTKSSSINFRKFQHEYTFILVLRYPYSNFLTCAVCNHVLFLRCFWPVNLSFEGESLSGIETIIKNPHLGEGLSNWSGQDVISAGMS